MRRVASYHMQSERQLRSEHVRNHTEISKLNSQWLHSYIITLPPTQILRGTAGKTIDIQCREVEKKRETYIERGSDAIQIASNTHSEHGLHGSR